MKYEYYIYKYDNWSDIIYRRPSVRECTRVNIVQFYDPDNNAWSSSLWSYHDIVEERGFIRISEEEVVLELL